MAPKRGGDGRAEGGRGGAGRGGAGRGRGAGRGGTNPPRGGGAAQPGGPRGPRGGSNVSGGEVQTNMVQMNIDELKPITACHVMVRLPSGGDAVNINNVKSPNWQNTAKLCSAVKGEFRKRLDEKYNADYAWDEGGMLYLVDSKAEHTDLIAVSIGKEQEVFNVEITADRVWDARDLALEQAAELEMYLNQVLKNAFKAMEAQGKYEYHNGAYYPKDGSALDKYLRGTLDGKSPTLNHLEPRAKQNLERDLGDLLGKAKSPLIMPMRGIRCQFEVVPKPFAVYFCVVPSHAVVTTRDCLVVDLLANDCMAIKPRGGALKGDDLIKKQLGRGEIVRLLDGLKVSKTYGDKGTDRRIREVLRKTCKQEQFTRKDPETGAEKAWTTAAWLKERWNINCKDLPAIRCTFKNKSEVVPIEHLSVPKQALPTVGTEIGNKVTNLFRYSPGLCREITTMTVQTLFGENYPLAKHLLRFGIRNSGAGPLSLGVQIAGDPKVTYGGSKVAEISTGAWNLKNYKFLNCPRSKANTFLVIDVGTKRYGNESCLPKFVTKLVDEFHKLQGSRLGFKIINYKDLEIPLQKIDRAPLNVQNLAELKTTIRAAITRIFGVDDPEKWREQILFTVPILPKFDNVSAVLHAELKDFLVMELGLRTQCCKYGKTMPYLCENEETRAPNKLSEVYSKLIMGINTKIGGVNHGINAESLVTLGLDTVIVGADASHVSMNMGGKQTRCSILGMTMSLDRTFATYGHACNVQESGDDTEIFQEGRIREMLPILLRERRKRTDTPIKRVVFCRDGVDWGSLEKVRKQEVRVFEDAMKALGWTAQLTVAVCLKKHNQRIFNTAGHENVRPGSIVGLNQLQKSIKYPSFVMMPHKPLGGSCGRPIRVAILRDDSQKNPAFWADVINALAHADQVVTSAVSLPAPTYYASTLCDMMRDLMRTWASTGILKSVESANEILSSRLGNAPPHFYL